MVITLDQSNGNIMLNDIPVICVAFADFSDHVDQASFWSLKQSTSANMRRTRPWRGYHASIDRAVTSKRNQNCSRLSTPRDV